MKKIITLIAAIVMATTVGMTAQVTASQMVKESAAKLTSAKTFKADMVMSSPEGGVMKATLTTMGRKFSLKSDAGSVVYDGKTQWTVSPDIKEINIYEPTEEEVVHINPLTLINKFAMSGKVSKLTSSKGKMKVQITGLPDDLGLKKAIVMFDETKKLPTQITLTLTDGSAVDVQISKLQLNPEGVKAGQFKVTTSAYPGYEVIDMR